MKQMYHRINLFLTQKDEQWMLHTFLGGWSRVLEKKRGLFMVFRKQYDKIAREIKCSQTL